MRMVMGRSRHFERRPFTRELSRDDNDQDRVIGHSLVCRPVLDPHTTCKTCEPLVALTCVPRAYYGRDTGCNARAGRSSKHTIRRTLVRCLFVISNMQLNIICVIGKELLK
eukprot:9490381-Pyramimonas_sp.AAC.1